MRPISAVGKESLDKLRLEELNEGRCVQTLHIGSFDNEGPILKTMHEQFVPENGLTMRGKHHEIYLSDFRRTPPEKLRTILGRPTGVSWLPPGMLVPAPSQRTGSCWRELPPRRKEPISLPEPKSLGLIESACANAMVASDA